LWQHVWSVQCAMVVKKGARLQEIKRRVECFIREPFIFLPTGAMILIIMTVSLGLISYYYDVMDLQEWMFCVSLTSFMIAYSIGSLMHRFNIKRTYLKIIAVVFLSASNVFLLLGLTFTFLTQSAPILDSLIIISFSIVWVGVVILYSLRMAYRLLEVSREDNGA